MLHGYIWVIRFNYNLEWSRVVKGGIIANFFSSFEIKKNM